MDLDTPQILALWHTRHEPLSKGLKFSGLQVHRLGDEHNSYLARLLSSYRVWKQLAQCLESGPSSNTIAGFSVSDEKAWPKLTVLTIKGTREVNNSLNHKGGRALSAGKAQVEGCLSILPDLGVEFPGQPTKLTFSWVLLESTSTPCEEAATGKDRWEHCNLSVVHVALSRPRAPAPLRWESQKVSALSPARCFPSLRVQQC